MAETSAQFTHDQALLLALQAKRSSRWYAVYLVIYAVGTFLASVSLGALATPAGVIVSTTLWVAIISGLTVYSSRQKATVRRFALLHGLVIGTWAGLWGITVLFGTMFYGHQLWWWIGGGVACALPPLVGALIVMKQTR